MVDDRLEKTIVDKNITAYKVAVSILFGLLGFVINFQSINFSFPPYTATILIGLLFPMLITLAWGWRYGLLSALAGGCQSMWWIWGPSNGYATFFIVPPFTLWILWHGFFAKVHRQRQGNEWWLNAYVVEIPFRILSTINLYTLTRWAITLNPPSWDWACSASNTVPMEFSSFVVIKQFVVGYIILLLADVLLNLGFVRRFFRMEEQLNQTKTGYIISTSLLLGVLFWIIDSLIGSWVFYTKSSFLDLLALNIPPYVLFVRCAFILCCLTGGMIASSLLRKQRESEVALRESEKRLSQIVEGSSVPTFVIDKKHTITHWNKACENLSGVMASEMVGTRTEQSPFFSTKRPVLVDVIVDELAQKEITRYYSGKFRKSALIEGAYEAEDFFPGLGDKWLFFAAAPLRDEQGKVIGAIETLRDITERKIAETKLKRTLADLERSNTDLEQFAYVVSHDLQEPLRMVSSYVQLLARRYEGKLDPDADDFIGFAVDGANRMHILISDLLTYSRVATHSKQLTPIDCEDILKQVLTNLQVAIQKSSAVVTHDALPRVIADASQLAQLFQNLVGNAIKFRSEEPPRIHILVEQKGDEWEFSVADNGIGIEPEFFDRIFVIFQRLHSKDEYSGTGIGLAVCKKIVERHSGRMWVESEPGKGTTFFFTLPVQSNNINIEDNEP